MPPRRSIFVRQLTLALVLTALASGPQLLDAADAPRLQLGGAPRLTEPDVREASEDAAKALLGFRLPPGLSASLWAAEPMLANPVAFNFDDRGRMFVAETYRYRSSVLDIRDYMPMLEDDLAARTIEDRTAVIQRWFGEAGARELARESELLRLLEDRDGDGVADFTTIYADGFNSALDGIASGVLPGHGGVYFTNIPSLWFFTGRERAETRKELSRGYGVRFNFTGHDLHGLAWGPDGKLYFTVGDRGAHIPVAGGGAVATPDTGAVFRCNPDGSDLEIVHRGLRNPQDLLFTENGDLFTGDNDSDQGDMERLVQIVEGGDSGWRVGYQFAPLGNAGPWNLERMWTERHATQPADIVPPICNIEDGPSGIAYHPGTGFDPAYRGKIFITHFKGAIARSGIYTYTLKQEGATYRAVASEELLGNALPTDVAFGPDGRLYYSDWAEGWPKSKRGRIYTIDSAAHRDDPARRETQALLHAGMEQRNNAELARLLAHADQRVRLAAQFALAARGEASVAVFAGVAHNREQPSVARWHALWGLGQLAGKNITAATTAIRPLLGDSDSEVRAQATRLLGDHDMQAAAWEIAAGLTDENARVRFFAAQSLGKLGRPEFAPQLLAALRANDDRDPYLRHAIVLGLARAATFDTLIAAAVDPSRAVRLGVLLALRRQGRAEVAQFLHDADAFIVAEAARAINDEPIPAAWPKLAAFVQQPRDDQTFMLRVLNAAFRTGTPEQAEALARFAARGETDARLRADALEQLALWPQPPARDRIVGVFRPLPETSRDPAPAVAALQAMLPQLLTAETPAVVQQAAFRAIEKLALRAADAVLLATVRNEKTPGEVRAGALEMLDKIHASNLAEAVAIAAASRNSALQMAALPISARLSPEAMLPVLEGLATHGGVSEQRAAYTALAESKLPDADRILAARLRALPDDGVPIGAQLELLEAAARRTDPTIVQLLAARAEALTASGDLLAAHRYALQGGRVRDGRNVFNNHPVLACQRCHVVGGQGGEVGPDLSLVGTRLDREALLAAVLTPNATIAEGFETIAVTLKSGTTHVGIVATETPDTLTLRLGDGALVEVAKPEITDRTGVPSSMPAIYDQVLTKQELRDLIAYLASLNVRPRPPGGPRALTRVRAVSTEPETDTLEK